MRIGIIKLCKIFPLQFSLISIGLKIDSYLVWIIIDYIKYISSCVFIFVKLQIVFAVKVQSEIFNEIGVLISFAMVILFFKRHIMK